LEQRATGGSATDQQFRDQGLPVGLKQLSADLEDVGVSEAMNDLVEDEAIVNHCPTLPRTPHHILLFVQNKGMLQSDCQLIGDDFAEGGSPRGHRRASPVLHHTPQHFLGLDNIIVTQHNTNETKHYNTSQYNNRHDTVMR